MGKTMVRLIHDMGGPVRLCPLESRGTNVFVYFGDTSGEYRVNRTTGRLMSVKKKNPWSVHPEDFKTWKHDAKSLAKEQRKRNYRQ